MWPCNNSLPKITILSNPKGWIRSLVTMFEVTAILLLVILGEALKKNWWMGTQCCMLLTVTVYRES